MKGIKLILLNYANLESGKESLIDGTVSKIELGKGIYGILLASYF